MKRKAVSFAAALFIGAVVFAGCAGEAKKPEAAPAAAEKVQYQCPMKCSEQLFDKPGKCPNCEMELIPVTKS